MLFAIFKTFWSIWLVCIVLALGGCAFFSKPVGIAAADRFQPGITTVKQAAAVLGRPQSIDSRSNGNIVLSWLHKLPQGTVPATQGVTIEFAANGKMVQILSRYEDLFGH